MSPYERRDGEPAMTRYTTFADHPKRDRVPASFGLKALDAAMRAVDGEIAQHYTGPALRKQKRGRSSAT